MKHLWKDCDPPMNAVSISGPFRRCTRCGMVQGKMPSVDSGIMRVTGKEWYPKSYSCIKKKG